MAIKTPRVCPNVIHLSPDVNFIKLFALVTYGRRKHSTSHNLQAVEGQWLFCSDRKLALNMSVKSTTGVGKITSLLSADFRVDF